MPMYCYKCPECDHRMEEMRQICDRNCPLTCPKCMAADLKRNFQAEQLADYGTDYAKPQISDSMAVGNHPDLIKEQQQRHPGMTFTKMGQPVFRNRREKLNYMKKEGFVCKNTYTT